jgi:hydroxymethylbilane synthase
VVAIATTTAMTRRLRIATRTTELALRRSRAVQTMLETLGITSELLALRTAGDKHHDAQFRTDSVRALFSHELEQAVLKKRADVAVHACPDLPVSSQGLTIAAIPRRGDARDALVLNELFEGTSIEDLPNGTRIGTSSVRCRALLQSLHPNVEVVQLRGDLPERLRKVDEGQVHATIAPADALHRLEVSQRIAAYLEAPAWLPAPAQGAIAVQIRDDDPELARALSNIADPRTTIDVAAERSFFAALEGGIHSTVSALVVEDRGSRVLHGIIADPDGRSLLRGQHVLEDAQPELDGVRLANELRGAGASRILDLVRRAERVPTPQPDSV